MDYTLKKTTLFSTSTDLIYLDHQNTWFGRNKTTISFKIGDSVVNCSNKEVVSRPTCGDGGQIVKTWSINSTLSSDIAVINHADLVNATQPVYFHASAYSSEDHNLCGTMLYDFQVEQNSKLQLYIIYSVHELITIMSNIIATVETETLKASFTRSEYKVLPTQSEDTVYIVFPRANALNFDCPCPIVFSGEFCTNLAHCSCINNTIFSSSIEICNSTEGIEIQFNNLTAVMNGSRIFFFQNYNCEQSNTIYRKYLASYEIIEGIYIIYYSNYQNCCTIITRPCTHDKHAMLHYM